MQNNSTKPLSESELAMQRVLQFYPTAVSFELIDSDYGWAIFIHGGDQQFSTIKKWHKSEPEAWLYECSKLPQPLSEDVPDTPMCTCGHEENNHWQSKCTDFPCACEKFTPVIKPVEDGPAEGIATRPKYKEGFEYFGETEAAEPTSPVVDENADNCYRLEKICKYIESESECLMSIIVDETKKDYGIRLLRVIADELRDKFGGDAIIDKPWPEASHPTPVVAAEADDDNFTTAARFAGITFSQGCQFHLMMQHLLGKAPAPGFLILSHPAQFAPVVVSAEETAVKLLADVMHLWIDDYIGKSSNSMAPVSIAECKFQEIEQFLFPHGIAVDYCGVSAPPSPLPNPLVSDEWIDETLSGMGEILSSIPFENHMMVFRELQAWRKWGKESTK